MVKILFLSFYYPPDLSAGSFRASSLVDALIQNEHENIYIDLITSLPNRYKSYSAEAKEFEKKKRVNIYRVNLPGHKGGMLDQSCAYISFFKNAIKLARHKDYDLVFATSGRLMTAVLGAWISSRKKAKLYLDIRDIFVDTINDVLTSKIVFFVKPFFSLLERWAINKANKVNLVSDGFREYFQERYPKKTFSFFTNGIDDDFIYLESDSINGKEKNAPLKIVYAGNIGDGQGLHLIIPKLAKKTQKDMNFYIVGDGGCKKKLQESLVKHDCDNVELLPPVERANLISIYLDADILFLHLNDYDAFKKVLPSKIFEYAALGKPIWAGVSGYAAEFINKEVDNAVVFSPCDSEEAINVLRELEIIDERRTVFVEKFDRKNIMNLMAGDVLSITHKNI